MKRVEPKWLDRPKVITLHGLSLSDHGGLAGIRDETSLGSALARPVNKWHYEELDLFDLAAAYAYGLVMNHPFADGNKRTGFLAAAVFLRMNGLKLTAPETEAVVMTLDMAASLTSEERYGQWLRDRTIPWPNP